ncbi:SDR family NAD(P)-dependent oxidoreductase [Candidatus Neomarinimicrobiota bacterium]
MNESNLLNLISLKSKIAVITGGASGIGLGTAIRLAEAGADIAVLDIQVAKGQGAVQRIEGMGRKALFVDCDVRRDDSCRKAIDQVIKVFGHIDILFNNAGIAIRKNSVDLSEGEWDQALDVGLKGMYLVSHYVLPHMIKAGGGSIINAGSGWSLKGGSNAVSYCAVKGGVLNLTRAMAIDHGPQNIRVNCVCPGDVDTPLLRNECEQLGEDEDEFMKEAADRPLNRIGTPEDIANAVLFFASDMSNWITGSYLVVDGGGIA